MIHAALMETHPEIVGQKKISIAPSTRLKRLLNRQTVISLRKIVQQFNIYRRTIQCELKNIDVYCRKKERAPRYTEKLKFQNVLDAYIVHYWQMIMS